MREAQSVDDMAWEAARTIICQLVEWGVMSPQDAEHFRNFPFGRGITEGRLRSLSAETIAATIRRALREQPTDVPDYDGLGSGCSRGALSDMARMFEQPPYPTPGEIVYDATRGTPVPKGGLSG